MSASLQRAFLLQQQSRHADAERELRAVLAADPNDALAHAALAECLLDLDRLMEAHYEAQQAVDLAPDSPLSHYVMSRVMLQRNRFAESLQAIDRAIELESDNADAHALKSAVYMRMEKWAEALAAAEAALEIDPEHANASNYRALAQTHLGQHHAAAHTIHGTLERHPENSFTHAAHGWSMLHANEPRKALEHFKEALRLDPNNEMARAGMIEAIKAHNPLYRGLLAYFLWMARMGGKARWGFILGVWFGQRILRELALANPSTRVLGYTIAALYFLFVLLTWLAVPVSNLLLRLHPLGRYALSREERMGANLVGATIGVSLLSLIVALVTAQPAFYAPAVLFFLLALPLAPIMSCEKGWPRVSCALIGAGLAMLATGASLLAIVSQMADGKSAEASEKLAWGLGGLFAIGCFIASFVNSWLASAQPRR